MRRQYFYEVELTSKNGKVEKREFALKPHLGLGNATDLYIELLKDGHYLKVTYPKFIRMEEY